MKKMKDVIITDNVDVNFLQEMIYHHIMMHKEKMIYILFI